MPWITVCKSPSNPFEYGHVYHVTKSKSLYKKDYVDVYTLEGELITSLHETQCKELFIEPMWTKEKVT